MTKFKYFLLFFSVNSTCNMPSIIPKIKFIGLEKMEDKKQKWIIKEKIKSEVAYYYLYYKSGSDPMEIADYINQEYTNWRINERSLLYTMLKLSKNPNNLSTIVELRDKMEKIFKKSKYLWFGNFILALHYLTMINDNPRENFNNISNVVGSLGFFDTNKKYKKIVFYIANYYLSEHYLYLMKEHFRLRDFNVVIVYGQKVLLRFHIHPRAAMEALITLIETLLILESDNLVAYYSNILEENVKLNPCLEHYSIRLRYLKQLYS